METGIRYCKYHLARRAVDGNVRFKERKKVRAVETRVSGWDTF